MTVTIRYLAQVRAAVGTATEAIELPGPCSLVELFRTLAERHGPAFGGLLFDVKGSLQPTILLFVNDQQITGEAPLVREGDTITVLSPMAGG